MNRIVMQDGDVVAVFDPVAKTLVGRFGGVGEARTAALRYLIKHREVELLLERGSESYRIERWGC
jgi:hypothetical protein